MYITRLVFYDNIQLDRFLLYPYFVCQRFVQSLESSKDRSVIGIKLLYRIIDLQVDNSSHSMHEESTFWTAFIHFVRENHHRPIPWLDGKWQEVSKQSSASINIIIHYVDETLVASIQIIAFKHYFVPDIFLPHLKLLLCVII